MRVTFSRDEVHMGDDALPLALFVDDGATIADVVLAMRQAQFLPPISGGQATWIVEGETPVAVIAQQWIIPKFLVSPELPASALRNPQANTDFRVRYATQSDPDEVYESLRRDRPSP
jgi:hypothetical protein